MMKPNERSAFRQLHESLRSSSSANYLGVMNELFLSYSNFEFVRTLQGFFRSGRFDLALSYADSLSEQKYPDATQHFVANQFAALIKKYPWDPKVVKTDPESVATRAFLKSERRCFLLNRKFSLYDSFRSPNEQYLSKMRSWIQYYIGLSPDIERIVDNSAFGSGASLGTHGNATHLARKFMQDKWSVTPGAASYAYWALSRNPHSYELLCESKGNYRCFDDEKALQHFRRRLHIVQNNKLSFVPKTAKTHRVIAVEPLLNGLVQKGADLLLRLALSRAGIDLSNQQLNQQLARTGSLEDSDSSFVTIDLSSASDSISIGLAKNLLPPDWFDFLNSIRSKYYELNDKHYAYNKFCSMGNGYCFPLETLIFTACCIACGCGTPGTDFSVYGDDIIVRKLYASKVVWLLNKLGFLVNVNKTFLQGPFRESCGADWFEGKDVRPFTLDYKLDSIENIFKWLNLTRRNEFSTHFFQDVQHLVIKMLPDRFRFWRPFKGNPDSGIDVFGSEHLTSSNCFFDRKRQVWRCKELRHQGVLDKRFLDDNYQRSPVDMYALLSGSLSRSYRVVYTLRRKTRTSVTFTSYSGATSLWLPNIGIR